MNKRAFTMLELVFVIVVLGILAALAMPRIERDVRQEAADHLLSAIRYTQHMALMDNVILPTNSKWQRSYWSFGTQACKGDIYYEIGSDKDMEGDIDDIEAALDPANGARLNAFNAKTREENIADGSSPNIFLGKQYGIDSVTYDKGCEGGQLVAFDYMGRPHAGIRDSKSPDFRTYMRNDCVITFGFSDPDIDDIEIIIRNETGYVFVSGQQDL